VRIGIGDEARNWGSRMMDNPDLEWGNRLMVIPDLD